MKPEKEAPELALRGGSEVQGNKNEPTKTEIDDQDSFDWANDPSIVLERQPATAVYVNRRDELVIRQEADIGYDEDEFIFVRPDNAETLARAIIKVAKPRQRRLRLVDGGE